MSVKKKKVTQRGRYSYTFYFSVIIQIDFQIYKYILKSIINFLKFINRN